MSILIYVGIFLLMIGLPIAIVTLIIMAIVRKNKEEVKPESFEKTVRIIYIYVFLIVFLFMTVWSVIFAFNSMLNYIMPESKTYGMYANETPSYYSEDVDKLQKENILQNEKNESLRNLVTAIAMVAVAAPLFIYHTKLSKDLK